MTQEEAIKEIRKLEENKDMFGDNWIQFHGKDTVTLDGWFIKKELEILIQAME